MDNVISWSSSVELAAQSPAEPQTTARSPYSGQLSAAKQILKLHQITQDAFLQSAEPVVLL